MDLFDDLEIQQIRISALRAAWKPDNLATLRRIFRWYSKTFATPLKQVEDLPIIEVLQHWFEVAYEELEPEQRHNLAIELLETPAERLERLRDEKNVEDDFMRKTQELADKQAAKPVKSDTRTLEERIADARKMLERVKSSDAPREMKEATINSQPKSKKAEAEEITISYDENVDFDEDPMGASKKT